MKLTNSQETKLLGTLFAVQHQLTVGEASNGDKQDIAWCAKQIGEAIAIIQAGSKGAPVYNRARESKV